MSCGPFAPVALYGEAASWQVPQMLTCGAGLSELLSFSLITCTGPVPSWSCCCFPCRTAGTLFGEGFRAFVTDWDKVTATVSTTATSSRAVCPGRSVFAGRAAAASARAPHLCTLDVMAPLGLAAQSNSV